MMFLDDTSCCSCDIYCGEMITYRAIGDSHHLCYMHHDVLDAMD